MATKVALKRSIQGRQLKTGKLFISFDGTLATPLATGPDQYAVSSIVKNAAGDYTIILKVAYEQVIFVSSILCGTQTAKTVTAVAKDRVTIDTVSDDAAIYVELTTFDGRILH